jgi:hypothetical protein
MSQPHGREELLNGGLQRRGQKIQPKSRVEEQASGRFSVIL